MRNPNSEITITEDSNRNHLKKLSKVLIETIGAKFLDENDVKSDYMDYVDTIYWDFEYNGVKFTIHLEHYTGIVIFTCSSDPSKQELEALKDLETLIKKHYKP